MSEQIFYIILGLIIGGGIVWYILRQRRNSLSSSDSWQEHMMAMQNLVGEQMQRVSEQMDRRLQDNVRAMNESKDFLANRVSSAEKSVRSVSMGLGKLEQATSALQKTSNDIASFQQLLKNPKIRGSFGEVLLGNLLGDVMPQDRYELQYLFRDSGEIADAIIRLQDNHIVAVDAKFPLSNYELFMRAEDEDKQALRKAFIRDVKKHITDISKKYISPQEKTLDYAFMYIPIEGVYYETMVNDIEGNNLWEFCLGCKVIPVSPNSFLAYLQTVLVGLRGMKIEKQAREILQHLGQLRQDFGKFSDEFSTVGSHLNNAKNRYDDSARRLDKFTNRLEQIDTITDTSKLSE